MSLDFSLFLGGATRVVVVGVGRRGMGDDAAGVDILRRLRKGLRSPNVLLVEGGVSPENFTSQIRRFRPSHIIFIDATDFGAKPGELVLAEPEAITGQPVSTHTMPLSAMAGYLREQTGARIALLGIQPERVNLGTKMSGAVKASVDKVARAIIGKLNLI